MKTDVPVAEGKTYAVEIVGLGHGGEGVGKYQEFTVFVPFALPGERVEARIVEVKKNYARGEATAFLRTSPERVEPPCDMYERCGGCQAQHMTYDAQLRFKHRQVADAIARIGGLSDVVVHPTIGAAEPWHYRNKMQFPLGCADGAVVIGCYARGTHEVVDARACRIQHEANNSVALAAREIVERLHISVYDEKSGRGVLRHVIGRVGVDSGEVMVVLVTNTDALPREKDVVGALRERIAGLVSVQQNINRKNTNVIMGEKTRLLWGQESIRDRLGAFTFHISARSFFQVNTRQAEVLYLKALEYAGLTGEETVIDAYCGTGTITLFLARAAKQAYGIEIVEAAIADARKNAAENGVDNARFIVGDAVAVMPQLYAAGVRPDVIVVDPPRAGCAEKVLETFAAMRPDRIVYVSCNPASLARDLALLAKLGYKTREVQPVDMFSQTSHVETVCLLSKLNAKQHIDGKLSE